MLTGWQRLGIVITLLWSGLVFTMVLYEKNLLESRKSAFIGLVLLQEDDSDHVFPVSASVDKVERLKELYRLEKNSGNRAIDEKLEKLLTAEINPKIQTKTVAAWLFVPAVAYWLFYFLITWIAQGFRSSKQ